jgi:hypothetical protein
MGGLHAVEAVVDGAEGVANDRAEDHQGCDNNDGNQNKNQSVLDQTLTLLFRSEQHGCISPFFSISREPGYADYSEKGLKFKRFC